MRIRHRLEKPLTLMIVLILTGITLFAIHKALAEIDGPDVDGPLRAYVKRSVNGAWMNGYTEAECTEYGVY